MNYKQLATEERYQIYSLNIEGLSQKQIAAHLNRSPSTICRELNRNQGLRGYRPKQAQSLSDNRRRHAAKSIKVTATVYQPLRDKQHSQKSANLGSQANDEHFS